MFYAIVDTLDYPEEQIELANLALTELFEEFKTANPLFNPASLDIETANSIADNANDIMSDLATYFAPPCIVYSLKPAIDCLKYLDLLQSLVKLKNNPFLVNRSLTV